MDMGSSLLALEDFEDLVGRWLVRCSPQPGHIRIHKRFLNGSSDIEYERIPLGIAVGSPEEDEAFATIPDQIWSHATLIYMGFLENAADYIWHTWTEWSDPRVRRESDVDDGRPAITFLKHILQHIGCCPDVSENDDAKWRLCFRDCGINISLEDAIMDPRFRYLRLSHSSLHWVSDTILKRYVGLREIQLESEQRCIRLQAARTASSSQGPLTEERPLQQTPTASAYGFWSSKWTSDRSSEYIVLYKVLHHAQARRLHENAEAPESLAALHTLAPSDFSADEPRYYFTPHAPLAEYYAAYDKLRAPCESVLICCINVPVKALTALGKSDILRVYWPSWDWKELVWTSRRGDPFETHRPKATATLIIGSVARRPNSVYQSMLGFNEVTEAPERETLCGRMLDTCSKAAGDVQRPPAPYDRPLLLRLFCEHAQTADSSRYRFLDALCERVGPDALTDAHCAAVDAFADELVDGLFLPLKAVSSRYAEGLATGPEDADTTTSVCIFPPSPMTVDDDGELSPAGQTAAQLLAMLDSTAVSTLRQLHSGGEDATSPPNTNTIDLSPARARAFYQYAVLDDELQSLSSDARLLALHRSVAHILHETGAGAHIDAILQDTGTEDLLADGTTSHVGRLMQLRLDGWWDGRGRSGGSSWWVDDGRFAEE